MVMMQQEPGRPHVKFYLHPVEVRGKRKGHVTWEDREFVRITPIGGNLVVEREATEQDMERFAPEYQAFKKGVDAPTVGYPLRMWPAATPGFVKTAAQMDICTVEQMATVNDGVLQKLGPGARDWKKKAIAFLEAAENQGKVAEEVSALTVEVEQLKEDLARAIASNDLLKEQIQASK